jgi:hypothetical protein
MYEEFVYLLDLCILSYQLHAQTLIWPLDPYYEFSGDKTKRNKFMAAPTRFGPKFHWHKHKLELEYELPPWARQLSRQTGSRLGNKQLP